MPFSCSGAGTLLLHIRDRDGFKGHWFNYCLQISATFNFLSLMLPNIVWDVAIGSSHLEVKIKQHQFKVVVNLTNLTMHATYLTNEIGPPTTTAFLYYDQEKP